MCSLHACSAPTWLKIVIWTLSKCWLKKRVWLTEFVVFQRSSNKLHFKVEFIIKMDSEAWWAQWRSISPLSSFHLLRVCLAALTGCQLSAFLASSKGSSEPVFWDTLCLSPLGCFSEAPPDIGLTKTRLFRRRAERNKEEFPGPPCVLPSLADSYHVCLFNYHDRVIH